MKTKDCYTELAIQIATLQATVGKLLQLAMNPEPRKVDISYTVQSSEPKSDNENFEDSYK